jgi:serine/threonine protein kinase
VESEPLMIVMELVSPLLSSAHSLAAQLHGGALDEYLKKNRVPAQEKLDNMCMGVAWGLEYLHARNCMHRDIAARNVLYSDMTASAERPVRSFLCCRRRSPTSG